MLWGITGAHRAGKTTLARKIAEDLNIEFYETSTTKVALELGFDPVAPMTLADRVALQCGLLHNHLEQLDQLPRPLIVDRTPLDFLGYMMAEFTMTSHMLADQETLDTAARLYEQCIRATAKNYDMLFYLAPLDNYVQEEGKPAPNLVYQRHHALLVQGALMELEDQVQFSVIEDTDFEFRTDYVHNMIVERIDQIEKMRTSASFH